MFIKIPLDFFVTIIVNRILTLASKRLSTITDDLSLTS